MEAHSKLDVFFETLLQEILWSEKNLCKVLDTMKSTATTKALKDAFKKHEQQTKKQVERLEKIFGLISKEVSEKKSLGMQGLFDEGWKVIDDTEEGSYQRDVALIIAAQKVEHYEIATYGSLIALANILGEKQVSKLLSQTLEEEKATDATLSSLAEAEINEPAKDETVDDSKQAAKPKTATKTKSAKTKTAESPVKASSVDESKDDTTTLTEKEEKPVETESAKPATAKPAARKKAVTSKKAK